MTAREAERQLRAMLRRLRRRSGQISQLEILRYEAAIRELARRLAHGSTRPLSSSAASRIHRQVEAIVNEIGDTLRDTAAQSIRTISREIQHEFSTVHARLYEAAGLPNGGVIARFEVLPRRISERLIRTGGRAFTLESLVEKNMRAARAAVAKYIEAATGKVADEVAVNSILRLLDGKLPVDLSGLGLKPTDLQPAKGLLQKGRTIIGTESFNTMREGTAEGSARSPIILAGKWTLSDRHAELPSSPDECDDLANADSGLGPGWYLPEDYPAAPHPNCSCFQGETRVLDPDEWPTS